MQLVDFQVNRIIRGYVDTSIIYKRERIDNLPLLVVDGHRTNVLGCNWFAPLGIYLQGVHSIESCTIRDVTQRYQQLFSEELGHFNGPPVVLHLDESVRPIHLPPRRIPFAIKRQVEAQLDRLIEQGILVPVEFSD